jgi:uncharacterized protein YbjT (DUF2867 family)
MNRGRLAIVNPEPRNDSVPSSIMPTERRIEMDATTTLVLGATGKTGRRVAERLKARGLSVRLGSRSGEPPFDWDNPNTWPAALRNVGAVYITYYPDLAAPGATEAIRLFTDLAVKSGLARLVLLSGRGEPEA